MEVHRTWSILTFVVLWYESSPQSIINNNLQLVQILLLLPHLQESKYPLFLYSLSLQKSWPFAFLFLFFGYRKQKFASFLWGLDKKWVWSVLRSQFFKKYYISIFSASVLDFSLLLWVLEDFILNLKVLFGCFTAYIDCCWWSKFFILNLYIHLYKA